jgi:site-specific DNA-methyltransferase (adenine-specific)
MKDIPDKYFDLAIVDPPYGIGEDGGKCRTRGSNKTNGKKKNWDNKPPSAEYFNELKRISKNQIIFGGNYFTDKIPISRGWLYWQKELGGDYGDGELIWTSFDRVLKQYKKRSETFNRIHPTQKPVQLYKWLLKNYAKPTDKIIDTHGGSMSLAIAGYDFGIAEMVICEIDKEYYNAAVKRFEIHKMQQTLNFKQ